MHTISSTSHNPRMIYIQMNRNWVDIVYRVTFYIDKRKLLYSLSPLTFDWFGYISFLDFEKYSKWCAYCGRHPRVKWNLTDRTIRGRFGANQFVRNLFLELLWKGFVRNHCYETFFLNCFEEVLCETFFLRNQKRIFPCIRGKILFRFGKKPFFFRV